MSAEKAATEAGRWYSQACSDVAAARDSAAASRFEWACFQAQQAAEKAVKALWFHLDRDPWGHSVTKLVDSMPDAAAHAPLAEVREEARRLDKLYIPTRYPNGLPGMTPAEAYSAKEAEAAIADAQAILGLIRRLLSQD